ncbi:glycerate kinase [Agromyces laixinhei]|uniref:glycerate kinase n=1 Tax=Agromyces laixinhei TaxID=2585717 RepID=UPI0012EE740D|nr:glycerate kinase [Agromyces laixinhei]
MHVVIAPDSFKGTASAADAAAAIARGWRSVRADDEVVERPMADGGEGTLDAFEAAVPDARRMPITVRGPVAVQGRATDSAPIATHWLLLPGGTGVVELAATSGLSLVDPLAPFDAHTAGFGDAIAAALDAGVKRLLLAVGGSASTDGGVGALSALGARFLGVDGRPVGLGNRALGRLDRVELSGLRPLPDGGAVVLGDVTNPLLGEGGAAAVFGPQKGADAADIIVLEANLARFARLVPGVSAEAPGAGAAGGAGFGLLAWGAEMGGGAALVASAAGLAHDLVGADLVVTGEGRFDGQSEAGKAPSHVARLAAEAGAPVALIAGSITAEPRGFAASVALAGLAGDRAAAMADPVRWLEAAGARLASGHSSRTPGGT